jgi:hypothetical protein
MPTYTAVSWFDSRVFVDLTGKRCPEKVGDSAGAGNGPQGVFSRGSNTQKMAT